MDKQLILDTVKSLKHQLDRLAPRLLDGENEQAYQNGIAAQHLINEIEKHGVQAEGVLDRFVLDMCMEQVRQLGRYKGMIAFLGNKHPFIQNPYAPLGFGAPSNQQLLEAGRDFWLMYQLLQEDQRGDNQQTELPRSTGAGGEGRPVQPGGIGLLRNPVTQTPKGGGPGSPPQGRDS